MSSATKTQVETMRGIMHAGSLWAPLCLIMWIMIHDTYNWADSAALPVFALCAVASAAANAAVLFARKRTASALPDAIVARLDAPLATFILAVTAALGTVLVTVAAVFQVGMAMALVGNIVAGISLGIIASQYARRFAGMPLLPGLAALLVAALLWRAGYFILMELPIRLGLILLAAVPFASAIGLLKMRGESYGEAPDFAQTVALALLAGIGFCGVVAFLLPTNFGAASARFFEELQAACTLFAPLALVFSLSCIPNNSSSTQAQAHSSGRGIDDAPMQALEPSSTQQQGSPQVSSIAAELGSAALLASVAKEYGLTKREEEVLEMIARGATRSLVAERLCISENTAKAHIGRTYAKLGVHNKDELWNLLGL